MRPRVKIINHFGARGAKDASAGKKTVWAYYKAEPGDSLDLKVTRAMGKYWSGSGSWLGSDERDSSATVPEAEVNAIVSALKAIPGVRVRVV